MQMYKHVNLVQYSSFFFFFFPTQLFQVFLVPITHLSAGIIYALRNKMQNAMGLWTVLMEVMKAAAVSPSHLFELQTFHT